MKYILLVSRELARVAYCTSSQRRNVTFTQKLNFTFSPKSLSASFIFTFSFNHSEWLLKSFKLKFSHGRLSAHNWSRVWNENHRGENTFNRLLRFGFQGCDARKCALGVGAEDKATDLGHCWTREVWFNLHSPI